MKKLIFLAACMLTQGASAAITVKDDDGRAVTLAKPAMRVISLAPHVTEMVYAAGGADRLVAAVDYSDYPEAAKKLPRVGSNRQIDMERVAALKPDLIVVWMHGSSERQIDQIRALGFPVFHSEPKKLDDIASNLTRIGQLMGTEPVADSAAAALRAKLAALSAQYSKRAPVRMFYQFWNKPLYTLNGEHIISDAARICGAENVFARLKVTAPVVDIEGVLQEDPEVIISGSTADDGGLDIWKATPSMTAVKRGNLYRVDGNLLNRSGPRMIDGAAALCEKLDLARQRRKAP
ncbi:cobalamin-binding protein [Massilia sp. CF038]|uniref:cobalamin-binding protein n=1 Tax=Massilia sp. CF038 TaxID=1881045 RepID=UPI000919E6F0|nr:cobalamin-binding protein [Massilia sp. CF038]SHH73164.1 iron complex transport system substrate-binding protein [Massilia sp. CF038]